MHCYDGNDSLIGQIVNKFPIVGDIINFVKEAFLGLFEAAKFVFETIVSLVQIAIAVWQLMASVVANFVTGFINGSTQIQSIIAAVKSAFKSMGDWIIGVFDGATSKVKSFIDLLKTVANFVKGSLDKVKSALGIEVNADVKKGKDVLSQASSTPLASMSSNAISNSNMTSSKTTSVQTGPITVNTQATDANGIAGAIGNSMDNQMRQAVNQFDDGVLA